MNSPLNEQRLSEAAQSLSRRWIVVALVYFVAAVTLGVVMGASHDFRLKTVHVHANLLGWVSMAIMGMLYRLYPKAAASRLARWHFVLYQTGLPAMLCGLAALMLGLRGAEPLVGIASVVMLGAVICFALAVWMAGDRSVVQLGPVRAAA